MTPRQESIIRLLLKRPAVSTNDAGQHLLSAGLLNKSGGQSSNLCLAGSAVLRSLEAKGWVDGHVVCKVDWARKMYSLTREGCKVAEKLP